ncbi:MAG: PilC/PilY family type IV pilus protein [Sulfuritalea sp.]|nr:PilC/PilY family type IV pilus protein [Sulfuritalea sp.]
MFILDDSGSMELQFMPDSLDAKANTVGIRNGKCNTVYYNPALTYETPQTVVGTTTKTIEDINSASPTTFTSAYEDGFYLYTGRSLGTYPQRNLETSFRAFQDNIFGVGRSYDTDVSDPAQPAYYWTYLGATTLVPATGDCNKALTSSTDSTTAEICTDSSRYPNTIAPIFATCAAAGKTALWRKTIVTGASGPGLTDERQNFANWYSYYRQRLTMMKSAAGKAFLALGNKYRVGFVTINPNNPVSSSRFLKLAEYTIDQKKLWIEKLYQQDDNGSTPLREALARVGRYYGGVSDGINSGMITDTTNRTDDPVQYSCQQNFAILTTDGYWNGNAGVNLSSGGLGNQDGVYGALGASTLPASEQIAVVTYPIYDGATVTRTTKDASNLYSYLNCPLPQAQQKVIQWQSQPVQTGKLVTQLQKRDGTLQVRTANLQRRKSTNSGSSWGSWSDQNSCTWDTQGSTQYQCRYQSWSSWSTTSSCIANPAGTDASNGSTWSGDAVGCQISWGGWSDTPSCSPDTTGSSRRECQNVTVSETAGVPCTPGTDGSGQTTTCTVVPTGPWTNTAGVCTPSATLACQSIVVTDWTNVATCTASGPDGAGQETLCQTVASATPGNKIVATTTYTTTTTQMSGDDVVGTPTTSTSTGSFTYDATCYAAPPALPSPNPKRPTAAELPAPPVGCAAYPCVTTSGASGGSSDTLADVAQYYFATDLRACDWDTKTDAQRVATGQTETAYCLASGTRCKGGVANVNVCENNVPRGAQSEFPNEDDKAHWQHMTTFTMGLGLTGVTAYSSDYRTAKTGDFQNIRDGNANWPNPNSTEPAKLDDLWHAAVNGRGLYFSASNPQDVATGLSSALAGINDRVGSAAAAATSNLEPVSGDNYAFTAKYTTGIWTGDLEAREIDLDEGTVSKTAIWSAAEELAKKTKDACDTRVIKLFRSGATNNLVNFTWNTFTCDASGVPTGLASTELNAAEKAHFGAAKIATLDQYTTMTDGSGGTVNQPALAADANLVNFIRGQRGYEGYVTNTNQVYRQRSAVLGDIVNAQPVFVRKPFAQYTEAGYADFKTANAARAPVVYAAANDGMLHAFDADPASGAELWAFMPTFSLPDLAHLANTDYPTNHHYFTDGTPVVADIYDDADATPQWKTILVAGLNKGGKGYYALDITNPANPKALWEFTDSDMGYTFGNPMVVKLKDGRWVVIVTSGLNNADGKGYLYVLRVGTAEVLYKIATTAGSAATPSGLTKITGWAVGDPIIDNTVNHIYGVDILGNIWRFDVNDLPALTPEGREATLLATAKDAGGTPQPITIRPELGQVGPDIVVYVGTGKYLGDSDPATTQVQSVYAIKDVMAAPAATGAPVIADLRATLTKQTITQTGSGLAAVRDVLGCAVASDGWYVDLPDTGERVNVDMKLQLGSLVVGSNVPIPGACRVGGYSWLNYFGASNGCAVNSSDTRVGQRLSDSLVVGLNVIRLPSGKTVVVATTSDAKQPTLNPPFSVGNPEGRRLTWREIIP